MNEIRQKILEQRGLLGGTPAPRAEDNGAAEPTPLPTGRGRKAAVTAEQDEE
jgi:hypothetical protein